MTAEKNNRKVKGIINGISLTKLANQISFMASIMQ
jgi:hypothetical protein